MLYTRYYIVLILATCYLNGTEKQAPTNIVQLAYMISQCDDEGFTRLISAYRNANTMNDTYHDSITQLRALAQELYTQKKNYKKQLLRQRIIRAISACTGFLIFVVATSLIRKVITDMEYTIQDIYDPSITIANLTTKKTAAQQSVKTNSPHADTIRLQAIQNLIAQNIMMGIAMDIGYKGLNDIFYAWHANTTTLTQELQALKHIINLLESQRYNPKTESYS